MLETFAVTSGNSAIQAYAAVIYEVRGWMQVVLLTYLFVTVIM